MANGKGSGYNAHSKLPPHRRPTQVSGQADASNGAGRGDSSDYPGRVVVKTAKRAVKAIESLNPFD